MGAAVNSSGKGRSIHGVRGASTSATTTTTGRRVTSGVVAPTLELVASIGIALELKAVAGSGGVSSRGCGTVENLLQWTSCERPHHATNNIHASRLRLGWCLGKIVNAAPTAGRCALFALHAAAAAAAD